MDSANPRLFSPTQQIRFNPSKTITQPSDILHHDVASGTRQLLMYALASPDTPRVVKNSLVISIAGGTKGYRIFFAPDSALNSSGALPKAGSRQLAELYALEKALEVLEAKYGDGRTVSRVVIITTAKGVVEGLSRDIWEWGYSGYKGADGKDVVDGSVFKELHKRIGGLEGKSVDVCFWLVEQGWNGEAEGLASSAAS